MLNNGNQILNFILCLWEPLFPFITVPVPDGLRQKVTVPTVPVPQHCTEGKISFQVNAACSFVVTIYFKAKNTNIPPHFQPSQFTKTSSEARALSTRLAFFMIARLSACPLSSFFYECAAFGVPACPFSRTARLSACPRVTFFYDCAAFGEPSLVLFLCQRGFRRALACLLLWLCGFRRALASLFF